MLENTGSSVVFLVLLSEVAGCGFLGYRYNEWAKALCMGRGSLLLLAWIWQWLKFYYSWMLVITVIIRSADHLSFQGQKPTTGMLRTIKKSTLLFRNSRFQIPNLEFIKISQLDVYSSLTLLCQQQKAPQSKIVNKIVRATFTQLKKTVGENTGNSLEVFIYLNG